MAKAASLAYQRKWTRVRDQVSERVFRELRRQQELSHVPTIVLQQFAQLGVRSNQHDRKIHELENAAKKRVMDMDAESWARWCFLVTEHRRCALAIASLAKSIFGDEHRRGEGDLVAMMAQAVPEEATETVEPESSEPVESPEPEPVKAKPKRHCGGRVKLPPAEWDDPSTWKNQDDVDDAVEPVVEPVEPQSDGE